MKSIAYILILVAAIYSSIMLPSCSHNDVSKASEMVERGRQLAEEGRFHDALSEFSNAIQNLDKTGAYSPDIRTKAYNGLGSISFIFGDTLSAIAYYEQAWKWSGGFKDKRVKSALASNLANAYNGIGKTDSARIYNNSLRILQKSAPDFPAYQYYLNLGRIEFSSKQWTQTINALDSAIIIMANDSLSMTENSELYILLAEAHLQLGNIDDALAYIELGDANVEGEENDNNRLRIYRHLESIYHKTGNENKARIYAEKIEKLKKSIVRRNRLLESTNKFTENKDDDNRINAMKISLIVLILALISVIIFWKLAHKEKESANRNNNNNTTKNSDTPIIARLDEIMKNTKAYKNVNFDISELAKLSGINSKYISRAINATGKNFRTFVAEYRINEAIHLLTDSLTMDKYTIESVAREVGYKSHSNFIAAFRKIQGTTPSEFLRNRRNITSPDKTAPSDCEHTGKEGTT